MTYTPTIQRNVDLPALLDVLNGERPMRHDLVVQSDLLSVTNEGRMTVLTDEGLLDCTIGHHAANHLAEKLGIPRPYWQRMASDAAPLLATNANHWLTTEVKPLMVRLMVSGGDGYVRAVMSDRYSILDDLDVTLAALQGLTEAGVSAEQVQVTADRSEARMSIKITAPQVGINVADLLGNYTSPFNGRRASDLPMMWAGLVVSNSETGGGAFTITPRVVLQVCTNGMTRPMDVTRAVHLGGRQEQGRVQWSASTNEKALALVTSRTADSVKAFLSTDYLSEVANDMRVAAGQEVIDPTATLGRVAKEFQFTEDQQTAILNAFLRGAEPTVLGVGHAITAAAQQQADADECARMEAAFFPALAVAAR